MRLVCYIEMKEAHHAAISWWFDRSLKDQTVANDLVVNNPRGLLEQGKLAFAMGYNPGDRVSVARALARSMELPEPFRFAWNFQAAEIEKLLNGELRRALMGETQYDQGFFDNLAQQIQALLDQP